jgi:hypothetical protein
MPGIYRLFPCGTINRVGAGSMKNSRKADSQELNSRIRPISRLRVHHRCHDGLNIDTTIELGCSVYKPARENPSRSRSFVDAVLRALDARDDRSLNHSGRSGGCPVSPRPLRPVEDGVANSGASSAALLGGTMSRADDGNCFPVAPPAPAIHPSKNALLYRRQ